MTSVAGPSPSAPIFATLTNQAARPLPEKNRRENTPFGAYTPNLAAVPVLALKDKHSFKTEMDDVARLAMFPHLGKKIA
jgi:hypothetical protein